MKISMIVAVTENGAIGKDGDMLFYLKEDLKRFRDLTKYGTVIMGKRTYESLPNREPLKWRRNIIVSKTLRKEIPPEEFKDFDYHFWEKGFEIYDTLFQAIASGYHNEKVFIIGGAGLYNEGLTMCDEIYVTKIHGEVEGDTYFHLPKKGFNIEEGRTVKPPKKECPFSYTFYRYYR